MSEALAGSTHVLIYTDGACIGNPGPGGYGVVIVAGVHRAELSQGFRRTTNNRMEILAAIAGLQALTQKCRVTLFSDSEYVVKAMSLGWAKRWRAKGWKRNSREFALNPDLWERLLKLCEYHQVEFTWIRGHAGNSENERCDQLATQAAMGPHLSIDEGYESPRLPDPQQNPQRLP